MIALRTVQISAPAKINLGLEILGRRDDGYHEIRSVLAMVDLVDDLTFEIEDASSETIINGVDSVDPSDNLIMIAIRAFSERAGTTSAYSISVNKRIPAPAGLGAASSNAAATLIALNAMHDEPLRPSELQQIAAKIGSDVPFFLGSPTALVSGRGTELTALPAIEGWVLLVVPRLALSGKTVHLYGMLTPGDFTDGVTIQQIAGRISRGEGITPNLLTNTFVRPLREIVPDIVPLADQMLQAGCRHVALSGAGPAQYALFGDKASAEAVAFRLRNAVEHGVLIAVTPFRTSPVTVEFDDQ